MPVKQGSGIRKSGRVFGRGQKTSRPCPCRIGPCANMLHGVGVRMLIGCLGSVGHRPWRDPGRSNLRSTPSSRSRALNSLPKTGPLRAIPGAAKLRNKDSNCRLKYSVQLFQVGDHRTPHAATRSYQRFRVPPSSGASPQSAHFEPVQARGARGVASVKQFLREGEMRQSDNKATFRPAETIRQDR